MPFFERELQAAYGREWRQTVRSSLKNERHSQLPDEAFWDAHAILTVMWDHWNAVFRQRLGLFQRSLVSELREYRNLWAHQTAFSEDDAYRVVDTVQRLLSATGQAEEQLEDLGRIKLDLLRQILGRQMNDDLIRARSNRERMVEVGLFGVAGCAIIATTVLAMIPKNPLAGLILCVFTVVVFGYIVINRWRSNPPVHGVHECPKCRKVIYSEICPYCEAPPSSTIARGTSSLRLDTLRDATSARI